MLHPRHLACAQPLVSDADLFSGLGFGNPPHKP
jgi:hypothetical protein